MNTLSEYTIFAGDSVRQTPRDNLFNKTVKSQLFFIPWEIRDKEEMYKEDFTYVDLNIDDINDASALDRETTQHPERFRVDTVPGFSGELVKKIVEMSMVMIDQELGHSARGQHPFTDDMMLMIYRHVLLHAIRNPFQLIVILLARLSVGHTVIVVPSPLLRSLYFQQPFR
ncbi:hypothetical protein PRIPAC_76615 [Pristionchus pacificus]|uniref:Uncharacterized protein n=1 Tax=Pristionchus pacificus TaxID=54126 RepID=A0A2A6BZD6_PRIPA|nr:hypothetical protein PRIPAC_76615 [Pristionchus pacificus]|eukprot:PDM71372.1 hypothetical protein PRIPAC_37779 [Pristionchus pacificus]